MLEKKLGGVNNKPKGYFEILVCLSVLMSVCLYRILTMQPLLERQKLLQRVFERQVQHWETPLKAGPSERGSTVLKRNQHLI